MPPVSSMFQAASSSARSASACSARAALIAATSRTRPVRLNRSVRPDDLSRTDTVTGSASAQLADELTSSGSGWPRWACRAGLGPNAVAHSRWRSACAGTTVNHRASSRKSATALLARRRDSVMRSSTWSKVMIARRAARRSCSTRGRAPSGGRNQAHRPSQRACRCASHSGPGSTPEILGRSAPRSARRCSRPAPCSSSWRTRASIGCARPNRPRDPLVARIPPIPPERVGSPQPHAGRATPTDPPARPQPLPVHPLGCR